jgi:DNA-directed RNA polymerase subunit K/omega
MNDDKYADDDDFYPGDKPIVVKKDLEKDEDESDSDAGSGSNVGSYDDSDAGSDDGSDAGEEPKHIFTKAITAAAENNATMYPLSDDDDDDEDDDDDDDDENYLQKFDESLKEHVITDHHPELQHHNYDEIESLCVVTKDDHGNIIDPLHRTLPFLTKYEKSRILGERAKQIGAGAKPFVKIDNNVIDGYLIALAELEQKAIPFIVKRPLPNGGCEYWRLKDLEILA